MPTAPPAQGAELQDLQVTDELQAKKALARAIAAHNDKNPAIAKQIKALAGKIFNKPDLESAIVAESSAPDPCFSLAQAYSAVVLLKVYDEVEEGLVGLGKAYYSSFEAHTAAMAMGKERIDIPLGAGWTR